MISSAPHKARTESCRPAGLYGLPRPIIGPQGAEIIGFFVGVDAWVAGATKPSASLPLKIKNGL